MEAKYTSLCYVCNSAITPGQAIVAEPEIGWIHASCTAVLDDPVELSYFAKRIYGDNVHTRRDLAIYNVNLDAIDDALPGDPFDYLDF